MSHFAEISGLSAFTLTTEVSSSSGTEVTVLSGFQATVQRVLVVEQEFINTGLLGDPGNWIQCSYNNNIRNIYPGPGYIYESVRDIFYTPQPYPSWKLEHIPVQGLDENNNIVVITYRYTWFPPIPYPNDGGSYRWNEDLLEWEPLTT
jgi:hypothetical protein